MAWTGQNWGLEQPRFVTDLTGDGKADIVGFGSDGVWTALGTDGWALAPAYRVLPGFFGYDRGWRTGQHLRLLADLTGDGKADIVGFGDAGVWVARGNGDGTFGQPRLVLKNFGVNQGWRVDQHPRFVVDLTGNGKADIIGFGEDWVWVALNNGDGTFSTPQHVTDLGTYNTGWRVDQHPRFVADLTGDGKADIIGFGEDWVWVALNNGDGTFSTPQHVTDLGTYNTGWRVDQHPRFVVDLTGDGKADLVGFGDDGVWTAVSNGNGTFGELKRLPVTFSAKEGWRVDQHLRLLADLNGDRKADIIGFGNDAGPWIAVSNGDGTFQPGHFVRAEVGAQSPIKRKVLSLEFLQRKFDLFFNERARPLFQLRLNNDSETFGQSALTVAQEDATVPVDSNERYDHKHPLFPPKPMDYDFHMLNSDKLTLTLDLGPPVGVKLGIHFETKGPIELWHKIHGVPFLVNIKGLNIQVKFEFSSHHGLIDLVGFIEEINQAVDSAAVTISHSRPGFQEVRFDGHFRGEAIQLRITATDARPVEFPEQVKKQFKEDVKKQLLRRFIATDADVDSLLPDGATAHTIEDGFDANIVDALQSPEYREKLNQLFTRWLIGGDFTVVGIASDAETLTIDYIIPPGQLEPFPESSQPPLDPGRLANIDHIVVLMMENRSFDHMLGYLSKHGGRSDIDGLRGGEMNTYNGKDYPSFLLPDTTFLQSPDHSHEGVNDQINGGKCDGFVTSFAKKYPDVEPRRIMGYHNAATVPVYNALAREFLICQRWFSAHPGPTFCNRFYTLTGRLNRDSATGEFEDDNFTGDAFKPVATRTILDHLTEQGVDWRYYEHRYCFLRLFAQYTTDDHFIVDADDPMKGFFACAKAGTLPAVSFIDPNFIDEPDGQDNDDGAPADIAAGQNLIGRVVNAVMQGLKWQNTLLIITYDEHGGFYDHVNPMNLPPPDTAKAVSNTGHKSGDSHYGLRVPTFVISPWVDQGKASDVVFDHTSIIKTIARRFMSANPPDLGERVAAANDLSVVLRSSPRQDMPSIPIPPAPAPRSAIARRAAPAPDGDDFKEVMRALRDRYPIRR